MRVAFLLVFLLLSAPIAAQAADLLPAEASALQAANKKDWGSAFAFARESDNQNLDTFIRWQYLLDPAAHASFSEITEFMQAHAAWPEQKRLQLRAENALYDSDVSTLEILSWYTSHEPISGLGKWMLARALEQSGSPDSARIKTLLVDAWQHADFTEAEEADFLSHYATLLNHDDWRIRAANLLWEKKTAQAERLLPILNPDERALMKTRIALQNNAKDAPLLVTQIPPAYRHDTGLLFDRIRWRAAHDEDDEIRELLLAAPLEVPYPEKWWKIREQQIRKTIDAGKPDIALKLLNNHGQLTGNAVAEAAWLKGWLLLEFSHKPDAALEEFIHMYDNVRYPVSKARGAYWAGRAAAAGKDMQKSAGWYQNASIYPTTFYGQLALIELDKKASLVIPESPAPAQAPLGTTAYADMIDAIRLSTLAGDNAMAKKLLNHLMETVDDPSLVSSLASLGNQLGKPHFTVKAAKKAMQQNIILRDLGYPAREMPQDLAIEKPLALAIIRQESEFDLYAESPSRALGLMQLLPGTAREMAHKMERDFNPDQLYESDYNTSLGSFYLNRMINQFAGSYVEAIAAYNAGPGNVRKWENQMGKPGNNLHQAINWIEKIPFEETRNYVQRVLENLQVYRSLQTTSELQIAQDLTR